MSVDVRISGALVIPVVGPELDGGVVEVTGGRITHIGPVATDGPAAETLDAAGHLLLPGFVNTHCHTSQQLGRGLADDVDLLTWLRDRIWPYEAALDETDSEISALACCVEQIRNGVTLLADPGGQHVPGMARGVATSGIRAFVAASTMDEGIGLPAAWQRTTDQSLAQQDELAALVDGTADGRIRFSYTLRTIFNNSDALIMAGVERARAAGTPLQMHIAEVREENEHCIATRGVSTVRHLHRLGALGPWFLGAHGVWVDDEEVQLLASSGATVSHNMASNLKILGMPRIADMIDAGVRVALGTDGAPSNNRMSIVDEMWAAAIVQKGLRLDPTVLPARTVIEMATINGARALGVDDRLGSIEVGKDADLVLVDPLTANMATAQDLVAAVVTSMKTENIRSVMCAGRWVLRDRVVTTVDEREVLKEARQRAYEVRQRAGISL